MNNNENKILNQDIPFEAKQLIREKPYCWEYKFLAYILKNEINNLTRYQYLNSLYTEAVEIKHIDVKSFFDILEKKLNDLKVIISDLKIIIDIKLHKAMGKIGEPSNLNEIINISSEIAKMYLKLLNWGKYFKEIFINEKFNNLLMLLSSVPNDSLKSIENFVEKLYKDISDIPNIKPYDDYEATFSYKINIDVTNSKKINNEIEKVIHSLRLN